MVGVWTVLEPPYLFDDLTHARMRAARSDVDFYKSEVTQSRRLLPRPSLQRA